jgi:hypothetical protein
MKHTLLILLAVAVVAGVLYLVGFANFGVKATVKTPEIKKSDYSRPVKEGNCFRQRDGSGNSLLVCG